MENFTYYEMMVHVALCTNKLPQNVLIISNDTTGFLQEIKKHQDVNVDVISANMEALRGLVDTSYDVIISQMQGDAAVLAHCNRILKEDGLLVSEHPSLESVQENTSMMQILAKYTKVIMPFNVGGTKTALLASKEYHPTADIILQRADMLDDLEYYNCDIHIAAFAMGNNVRKAYLGVIKN